MSIEFQHMDKHWQVRKHIWRFSALDENLCSLKVIRNIFKKHDFMLSKSLGQNFLINSAISSKIAKLAKVRGSVVLEVGPGIGTLTKELAKYAAKVFSVELDRRLIPILKETLIDFKNVKIINSDILKFNLERLIEEEAGGLPVKICSNLPYYITSPFLMKVLESGISVESVTVMVQKEAANRLCALPGSNACGAISYAIHYYSTPKQLFNVSRGSFFPAPSVDSSVITLDLKKDADVFVVDVSEFFNLIRAVFKKRRKMLVNPASEFLHLDKEILRKILTSLKIPQNVRPQQLTLFQFANFFNIAWHQFYRNES